MRILITNDDGAGAAQLLPLIRWCRKLGEVTTIVPKTEQSAKSHSIEIHKAFEAKQVALADDVTIWTVDSTPADCVRFACAGLNLHFDQHVAQRLRHKASAIKPWGAWRGRPRALHRWASENDGDPLGV